MLEKKLLEEVNRFKSINKYADKLIYEQEDTATDVPATPEDPALSPEGGDTPPPPPADPTMGGADDTAVEPTGDVPEEPTDIPEPTSDVEEIDITDLVNMTKSIKKDIENSKTDNSGVISKMDDVFTKLDDLEQKIAQMDTIFSKLDQLDAKLERYREKTPEEKLELRSLDSYPFNQNPQQFFAKKQEDMRASGKNEYVLTKDEVQNYSPDTIKQSFNIDNLDDEFSY